ncbi:MAG: class I SAM-dependent methyltransferase [Marinosulfonomonas sp.]|nr:class I SAM-dependent methyltransferase [Marinosulfonomonas sp.]
MDNNAVRSSYKAWAPVYDKTFGAITRAGRRRAVRHINQGTGRVLEVGVGTGLSLRHYQPHLEVTGIDISPHMLEKARQKRRKHNMAHVTGIHEMDAGRIEFPDNHFDMVVAMYLVSVVPDPEQVISEMARVCKTGGEVIIVNHFAREKGALSLAEKAVAPFTKKIGWHSDFSIHRVLGEDDLNLRERRKYPPLGMFTLLRMEKRP